MIEYKKYRRTQIAEMADWQPGFDMKNVSISGADKENGSPKLGDKIARNPANYDDRWLVAKAYFESNFEALLSDDHEAAAPVSPPPCTCCNDLAQLREAFAEATVQEEMTGQDRKIADGLRERAFQILAKHVAEKHHSEDL